MVTSETRGGQTQSRIDQSARATADARSRENASETAGKYPYPASVTANRYADARYTAGYQAPQFQRPADRAPSLGIGPVSRTAQCNCNQLPAPPQNLQFNTAPAVGYAPGGYQPVPAPNYQVPATNPQYAQPTYAQPGYGYGYQNPGGNYTSNGTGWWTPFLTGSGKYTPLLNFRNMPPGTYLGQGVIGQPTAYVDGQAFRNLLRYVSP